MKNNKNKYHSEIVYGGVDGLVTTFSIIAGSVGINLQNTAIIILAIANIISDGFSMGVSSYLAEQMRHNNKNPYLVGFFTFISFVLVGIIPIIPFLLQMQNAFTYAIYILLVCLFLLGYLKGNIYQAFRTLTIGGITVSMAYYISKYLNSFVQ